MSDRPTIISLSGAENGERIMSTTTLAPSKLPVGAFRFRGIFRTDDDPLTGPLPVTTTDRAEYLEILRQHGISVPKDVRTDNGPKRRARRAPKAKPIGAGAPKAPDGDVSTYPAAEGLAAGVWVLYRPDPQSDEMILGQVWSGADMLTTWWVIPADDSRRPHGEMATDRYGIAITRQNGAHRVHSSDMAIVGNVADDPSLFSVPESAPVEPAAPVEPEPSPVAKVTPRRPGLLLNATVLPTTIVRENYTEIAHDVDYVDSENLVHAVCGWTVNRDPNQRRMSPLGQQVAQGERVSGTMCQSCVSASELSARLENPYRSSAPVESITVPWCYPDAMRTLHAPADQHEAFRRLARFAVYGPEYDRAIADTLGHVSDAHRFGETSTSYTVRLLRDAILRAIALDYVAAHAEDTERSKVAPVATPEPVEPEPATVDAPVAAEPEPAGPTAPGTGDDVPAATLATDKCGRPAILVRPDLARTLRDAQDRGWTEHHGCAAGHSVTYPDGGPVARAVVAVLDAVRTAMPPDDPRAYGGDVARGDGWSCPVIPADVWDPVERGYVAGAHDRRFAGIIAVGRAASHAYLSGESDDDTECGWQFYG